jgi:serine phosphatase RsbU (regulator of sigma subunit)
VKPFACLFVCCFFAGAKGVPVHHLSSDSLVQALSAMKEDTFKVNSLNSLSYQLFRTDADAAIRYGYESKSLSRKLGFRWGLAEAYKNTGLGYYMQGNYSDALINWEASLEIYTELGNEQRIANILSNMGSVYYTIGQHVEAIEYSLRALKLAERLGDTLRIGTLLLNMGAVYTDLNSLDSGLIYYARAVEIAESLGDNDMRGIATLNIGEAYLEKEAYDTALYYFEKALTILQSPVDIAFCLTFIGNIYAEKEAYEQALIYLNDALKLAVEENAQREKVGILVSLAIIYESLDQLDATFGYLKQAESIAEEIGLNEELSGIYEGLADNYAAHLDYRNAYKYLSLQNTIDNTIFRIESEDQARDLINTYQMEKKQAEIEILEQRSQIEQLISRRQKAIILSVSLFGVLLLAVAFGLNNRMSYIRKTNEKINAQNSLITDSITYAQRIQTATLPSRGLLAKVMPEHFILLKPKDIVSGDFYWVKEVQDSLVIVGADCTGHGVPGAFMSMLGITLLNDLIGNQCQDSPGKLLEQLRLKVKEMFLQEGETDKQKDGMEMVIAILNRNKRELLFAGANNPLFLVRDRKHAWDERLEKFASLANQKHQLYDLKGDSQPIGVHWEEKEFCTHSISLKDHDSFYIFSDGYVDQFGGANRKRFKTLNFKRLILSVQDQSMEEQKRILEQNFEEWRGNMEQIDDVTVIGVRV